MEKEKLSVELDEISIDELKAMSREELEKIPFDRFDIPCSHDCREEEGLNMPCYTCGNKTKGRDVGIYPWILLIRKNWLEWWNVHETFYVCSKHWKLKMYDESRVKLREERKKKKSAQK